MGASINSLELSRAVAQHICDLIALSMGAHRDAPASLDKLGAKIPIDQGYPNQSQDFTAVVLAIKSSGADIIGSYFTFPGDLAVFARQLRQLGVTLPWVGSPTTFFVSALKLGGPALWGTYGVADYAVEFEPGGEGVRRAFRRRVERSTRQLQFVDL